MACAAHPPVAFSACLCYWGKARPVDNGPPCHLLPFHSLDVAAVGAVYLDRNPALLDWIAAQLQCRDREAVREWVSFWLALHDLGKFSLSFQGQLVELSEQLQGSPLESIGHPGVRHDSLGLALWNEVMQPLAQRQAWFDAGDDLLDGLQCWVRAVTGHHGQPPLAQVDHFHSHFRPVDVSAATAFVEAARELLLTPRAANVVAGADAEQFELSSSRLSWWVAGLAVLADWIGSNMDRFPYRNQPVDRLHDYWPTALKQAALALEHSGVLPVERQLPLPFAELFPHIERPSPLQDWAAQVPLAQGPQLFLLEDVTGAGKTEAAVMLTHRLMAAGAADGFYIGLPTMATANAMYGRIATVYARLFDGDASLVLAHGRKTLVEEFAASVVEPGRDEHDRRQSDDTATRRCLRWLADHNKRALLSPAGVGTVDQALLAALQSKHQSLRLLGLTRKVLLIDEVHACDAYMQRTLEALLEFHANAGGSAILLSATLTRRMKAALLAAYARGCGRSAPALDGLKYPLATSWAPALPAARETEIPARAAVCRTVDIRYEPDRAAVLQAIVSALRAGQCVAWIRNTIGDALEAQAELSASVPADRMTLFHARFVLGDRLDIEERVLATFGPDSTPQDRAGRLLIATQVAEQSLDIDVDLLVTDLAPIDRLIQRAGRLRRHVRDADGRRLTTPGAADLRGPAWMWVHGPAWTPDPAADWLKAALPKAAAVYPHHGQMWRTARALQAGHLTMPDQARYLIEDVFDEDDDLPAGLQANATRAEGQAYGDASQAAFNSVKLNQGYMRLGLDWAADTVAPSRLGEDTIDVLLARWDGEALLPWRNDKPARHAWAYSTVRVAKRLIAEAVPEPDASRKAAIDAVLEQLPGGGKWVVLLPMQAEGDAAVGCALHFGRDGASNAAHWRYDARTGLVADAGKSRAKGVQAE